MNCFHFSVSLGYKTTRNNFKQIVYLLWIAFIFQYLWDTKQLILKKFCYHQSCELLSFFSIFGIQNNATWSDRMPVIVVNCFHFSVSLGYKTTPIKKVLYTTSLWIAFIFQYLWDTKQQVMLKNLPKIRCELLSFFSIFGIQNNNLQEENLPVLVVNCFHFSVSLGYKTTSFGRRVTNVTLWIAFIFQYLWDTKQPRKRRSSVRWSCI